MSRTPIPTPDQPRVVSYEPNMSGNTFLTEADFTAASSLMWGREMYGGVAMAILERALPSPTVDVVEVAPPQDKTYLSGELPGMPNGELLYDRTGLPTRELRMGAWSRWLDSCTPYGCEDATDEQFPDMRTLKGDTPVRVRLTPLSLVRVLLKRHLEHEGFIDHQLHGTFGMALDVMKVVGLGECEVGASNTTEPVVRRSVISKAMAAAGVSSHYRSQLRAEIEDRLFFQVHGGGRPVEGRPEIRVYGGVRSAANNFGWNYDSIAVDSLRAVAGQLPPHSPALPVLHEITNS